MAPEALAQVEKQAAMDPRATVLRATVLRATALRATALRGMARRGMAREAEHRGQMCSTRGQAAETRVRIALRTG